jgi:hypothetical protein
MDLYFDQQGEPLDAESYLALRAEESYRVVAQEQVGDVYVITSWLGTDQGPVAPGGPPLIFGSAAVVPGSDGGLLDDTELLAATLDQALANQRRLVDRVRSSRP